jgi:hypothetical protein
MIHGEVINVDGNRENYQVREIAELVAETVPGSTVTYAPGGEPAKRDYKVDFTKLGRASPTMHPGGPYRQA